MPSNKGLSLNGGCNDGYYWGTAASGKQTCLKDPNYVPPPQNNNNNNDYSGGATKVYNGRKYVVRKGSRGGKFILVKGRKVYL
jgi:hypothetical protein